MKTLPKFNVPSQLYYIAGRKATYMPHFTMSLGWTKLNSCNVISLTSNMLEHLIPIGYFESASVHSDILSALNNSVLNSGEDTTVLLSSPCIDFTRDIKLLVQCKGRDIINECYRLGLLK